MNPEQSRAFLLSLGLVPSEESTEESEDDAPVDFDGGAREPAPPEPDAEADHNATILEAIQNRPRRGGRGEW
jgi:hypothetical protein